MAEQSKHPDVFTREEAAAYLHLETPETLRWLEDFNRVKPVQTTPNRLKPGLTSANPPKGIPLIFQRFLRVRPVTGVGMSLQQFAIDTLNRELNGHVHEGCKGFTIEMKRLIRLGYCQRWSHQPDGYLKLGVKGQALLVAVEVEDTHKLSRDKLAAYASLWWELDCTDNLNFALIVTDRYGKGEVMSLCKAFYALDRIRPAVADDVAEMMGHRHEPTMAEIVEWCQGQRVHCPRQKNHERNKQRRNDRRRHQNDGAEIGVCHEG